jgi:maleate isomerase
LERLIAEASGAKAVVPSLALLDALSHLRAKRISVVTPYPAWNNQVLRKFLGETHHEILSFVGDQRPVEEAAKHYLWHQLPEEITEYVISNCHPEADCLLCPCTACRIFEVVKQIEGRLGIPVITANQATIWKVCKEIGMKPSSAVGTLMRSFP